MQRAKGKAFEKLIASRLWNALGSLVVLNSSQVGDDAGRDLLSMLPFCIQCSHGKNPPVWKKLKEARDSARAGEWPVAILRKDYQPIVVVMELDDWLELVRGNYK